MKRLSDFINENASHFLVSKKALNGGARSYKYKVKTVDELKALVRQRISDESPECNLNDIDVSSLESMDYVFNRTHFNGDVSEWDVSNVKDFGFMFHNSDFNGDISNWDTSNATSMQNMFAKSPFNGDISKWDVSNVEDFSRMFWQSKFKGDISKWNVRKCRFNLHMFKACPLEKHPEKQPRFK